jgi:hypothetical protein
VDASGAARSTGGAAGWRDGGGERCSADGPPKARVDRLAPPAKQQPQEGRTFSFCPLRGAHTRWSRRRPTASEC